VNASLLSDETFTFPVNRVTGRQRLGSYERFNTTDEFGANPFLGDLIGYWIS
jgi:hypothetical protein